MLFSSKTIYFYITKKFLRYFSFVVCGLLLLILILNLFDVLDRAKSTPELGWTRILEMSFLQAPVFLEDISIFLILLSSMITLFSLSSKSEITILRSSGLSLWHILAPIINAAFIIGIIFITVLNPISISASKKFNYLHQKYITKETNDVLTPSKGIWLKQQNILKPGEEILIRADKIYKDNIQLSGINMWFFDSKGRYYKKIDAENMLLLDGYWQLKDTTLNDESNFNKTAANVMIVTNLQPKFITQKIINNFENVKLFSVFELPKLISDLENSGFSSRKFTVYFYSLLNKPLLFVSMVMIAAFFSINNVRNRNNFIFLIIGVMIGLILYVGLSVFNAFGASGIIPPYTSTWIVSMIILAITILITFRKENI